MKAQDLIKELKRYNLGPYIEVPCSILAPVISRLMRDADCEVMNPVSEAVAMGLAAGTYLSRRSIPVLLIQNSGLCNSLNAISSLNQIYKIPVLLLISWRGEPGTEDAPEHDIMGLKLKVTLDTFNIPYLLLSRKGFKGQIERIVKKAEKTKTPAALILRGGLLEKEKDFKPRSDYTMSSDGAIDIIVDISRGKVYFVSTNGFISRELFYHISKKGNVDKSHPFYMLGSMGHALSIGLGAARYIKNRKVLVLDGDGGCLMHLGSMASVGKDNPSNLIHIVLDNGVYASTGNQPTLSDCVDFCKVAEGCGYKNVYRFSKELGLKRNFAAILKKKGPTFVHVLVNKLEQKDRPRISEVYSCESIKKLFMESVDLQRRG